MSQITLPEWLLKEPQFTITHESQLPGRWTVTLDRKYAGYGPSVAEAASEAADVREHSQRRAHRLRSSFRNPQSAIRISR